MGVSKKIIYLTGASGFIGNAVQDTAKDNYTIIAIPRPSLLHDPIDINFERGSTVIHLAARVHVMRETAPDPLSEFRAANTDITLRLAKAAIKSEVAKFIFLSSVSVTGYSKGTFPEHGGHPHVPATHYGISKYEAERGLEELFKGVRDTTCTVIRFPMVYGPNNKGNPLLLLKMAARGIPLPLGGANGKRSMMYVKNVADALLRIVEDAKVGRPPYSAYFVSDNHDITANEFYSIITKYYCGNKRVFYFPRIILDCMAAIAGFLENTVGIRTGLSQETISKLFDELRFPSAAFIADYGWQPKYSPEEGIKDTVEWHRHFRFK